MNADNRTLHTDTLAVHTALPPSQYGENSEALFLTSGYVQPDAATAARRFGGEEEGPAVKPDKQFTSLLKDGPGVGIFTIVRVDTSTNLERAMDRRMLKEFDYRVLFQMSANDSSNLIDSTAAGGLGQHRGLLYSEETGQVEKFRPYAVPEQEWLDRMIGNRPAPQGQPTA